MNNRWVDLDLGKNRRLLVGCGRRPEVSSTSEVVIDNVSEGLQLRNVFNKIIGITLNNNFKLI